MPEYSIANKPLSECTLVELFGAWELGMHLDSTVGLSCAGDKRHSAIEQEMSKREKSEEEVRSGCDISTHSPDCTCQDD